jgi:hypothetical protein
MAMSKQTGNRQTEIAESRPPEVNEVRASAAGKQIGQCVLGARARLQALLFAGAAFGTALLTLGGGWEPKVPPYKGE